MRLHPPTAALVLTVAGLMLSGCGLERPVPAITVFSGDSSLRSEAVCWSEDGAIVDPEAECGAADVTVETLEAAAGATIGIAVPDEVAEGGWVPAVGGQGLVQEPLTGTYYRFALTQEQIAAGPPLQVYALGDDEPGSLKGLWFFRLARP